MSENSTIEWCDHTFNPWEGCTKVSPGCLHCYAETRNHRFGGDNWGKGKPRRRTSAANWKQPIKWNRGPFVCGKCQRQFVQLEGRQTLREPIPGGCCQHCNFGTYRRPRVFCASLADWLDDKVPIEWLADLLKLIHDTPNLDWLLLTKRPKNRARLILASTVLLERGDLAVHMGADWLGGSPPSNVWIGVSVEDQQRADERIPELLKIPAQVHFISAEPLLGPIAFFSDAMAKVIPEDAPDIDWIIFGGESGPGARPCNIDWIRKSVKLCQFVGIKVFVKQVGAKAFVDPCPYCGHPESSHGYGRTVGCQHGDGAEANPICGCRKMHGEIAHGLGWPYAHHPVKHPKGGDPSEWPEDLRIRQFPNTTP